MTTSEIRLTSLAHGGGCGCKIAPGVLSDILKASPIRNLPAALLAGSENNEDAAVYLLNPSQAIIATTDFFTPIVDDPYDFGRIAATNAISDIYAMGGAPRFLLVAAGIPSSFTLDEIRELAQGIQSEADLVGARVIGGDLTRAEKLTISITVIGEVEEPILRSTARAGDSIVISALTGYSALGFELLKRGSKDARSTHHRKPNVIYSKIADLTAGERARFTALIDTSDSLVSEANHIASASGIQLQLSTELIQELPGFSEIDFLARNEHLDLWKMILHGGEDHRFLGTVTGDVPEGFFAIGEVDAGTGVTVDGVLVSHEGFDQFAIE